MGSTNMRGPAWCQKQNNKILETFWVSSPECILGPSICVFLWHLASNLQADEHNEKKSQGQRGQPCAAWGVVNSHAHRAGVKS